MTATPRIIGNPRAIAQLAAELREAGWDSEILTHNTNGPAIQPPEHSRSAYINRHCRCSECRADCALYMRNRVQWELENEYRRWSTAAA